MKHCLPKRFYKDMCLLDFCKMKMSIREATLNLQKPCTSARIAPWLAVTTCWLMSRLLQTIKFDGVRNNEIVAVMVRCKHIIKGQFEKTYYRPLKTEIFINNTFIL